MNAQNYTQKSLEAMQTAQAMAQENRNNYIAPEHLLYALVDQDGGLIPSLFGKMGVDCNAVLAELDTAISALPRWGRTRRSICPPRRAACSAPPRRPPKLWGTSTPPWST